MPAKAACEAPRLANIANLLSEEELIYPLPGIHVLKRGCIQAPDGQRSEGLDQLIQPDRARSKSNSAKEFGASLRIRMLSYSPWLPMDSLTKQQRSHQMSLVRCRDTKPEMVVRRILNALGYRYRLHQRQLPGTPDLVFKSRGAVVFVHGCFWHQHACAAGNRIPKSRTDFWRAKLRGNAVGDQKVGGRLRRMRWRVLTVWECQVSNEEKLARRLVRFLGH
jgi:DNA mismatch endonuclease (patch repair protein)